MNVFSFLKGDKVIWMIVVLLSLLSLLAVYSAIGALAFKHTNGDTAKYLVKHGCLILVGVFLMFLTHRMKYSYFSRISQIMVILSVPLLLYTLLRGSSINEANRWIIIAGQTFQTSDFAKLALIMYIARVVTQRQNDLGDFKLVCIHIMLPAFAICGLILPANLSTAALLMFTCFVIMFIGRVPVRHILKVVGLAIAGFALLLLMGKLFPGTLKRASVWETRIEQFFKGTGEQDPDKSYQANHAKIAIATGGLAGNGAGNSSERNFLPQAYSDFIFAIIIEEYGSIIGGILVVLLYIILLYRAVRVATRCERTFGTLLAFGISFSLIFQALINMAVTVNLLPVTGQPLPFLSMGGTSLLFSSIAVGIILSISRETEASAEVAEQTEKGGNIATA